MANSRFSGRAAAVDGPAYRMIGVVPDDGADLPQGSTRGLFVGTEGAVVVTDDFDNTVEFVSAASQYHPLQVRRVHATGTTAEKIVALY